MKKIYLMSFVLIYFALGSYAQLVNTYTFKTSNGTYTPVTTPVTVHASGWDDGIASVTIPFSFLFNGTSYTSASVNSNGYITFGATTSSTNGYLPISATTGYSGAISVIGGDLISNLSTVVSSTEGTAPNRAFVIQWNNVRRYSGGSVAGDDLSFQIRLNETSNTIDFVYGNCTITSTTALTFQVGLRGAANTDYNNRTATTTWATTASGASNSASMTTNSTITPASGQTYTWTPPLPCVTPADQPTTLTATGINSAQINGTFTAAASTPNGYLVVRYPSGGVPSNPVNGTTYIVGGALGTGTIVQANSNSTNFSATGLAATTTYDFYIYSENYSCTGGPLYLTTSPLTGSGTTTGPLPPSCATTFTPLNAATNILTTQVLNWSGATGVPAVTGYNVYFGTSSALVTSEDASVRVSTNQAGTSFTPTLITSTTYYWKVVPINSVGSSTGCLVNSFTTFTPAVPTCATTFTPIASAVAVPITQVLSWSGATGLPAITGYNLYFGTSSALVTAEDVSVRVISNSLVTSYTPPFPNLAYGTTYFWKLVSINSVGASTGCVVNSFTTYISGNITSTANGGLWSNAATWAGSVVPIAGDNVTITDGSIVTVDQLVSGIGNLTIGQGTSGILQWNASSNAMTLFGNLTVNAGATFLPYTTLSTGQTINIGGNFTNNGFSNLAVPFTAINFNGSQQAGGSLAQTLTGSGSFLGDGVNGFIRSLQFQTTGNSVISTTQNIRTTSFAHTAGTLNTNGKLSIDNTIQVYGQALNTRVASVAVTAMGAGYTSAPVMYGASASAWAASATANTRYYSGGNVYLCTTAGTFDAANPPTHTAGIVANGTANLLWLSGYGVLGNPFIATTTTAGTQYFYGNNLYVCTVAGIPNTASPPVHISGAVASGAATFLYVGTAATVSVNYDGVTSTVRSLNITNTGSGYSSAPTISFNGGGFSTTAAASVVLFQSIIGTSNSLTSRSGSATITGAISINNTQGASSQSGVGGITTANGGVNYTIAPLVGFAGPTAINLLTAGGSGYTTAPTITVTGGTLVSAAATPLASLNFTITVNQGKVVSVYLNAATSVLYSVPPTLAFTGGGGSGATLAFPSGCWPSATAVIGTNGQITNFNITNAGYGYVVAPTLGVGTTSGTAAGGTFTTVATAPTARIALYNMNINNFTPSPSNIPAVEDAAFPSNRKFNNLTLGSSSTAIGNLNLSGSLELFGTAPITLTGGVLNMGGNNLLFSWNGYAGVAGSTTANVTNGSMTLTTRGGGTTGSTLNFPFDATFTIFTGTGTTAANGASVLTVTASRTSAPTGTGNPIGTRGYRAVVNSGAIYGTSPTVTLNWNANDALVSDQPSLFVSQSAATGGPWVIRSLTSGTAGSSLATTGSRTTATTGAGPIVPIGDDYFAWTTTYVPTPLNYSIVRNTGITYNSIIATGTDYPWSSSGNDDNTISISLAAITGGTPTFQYQGQAITGVSVCTNGWLKLNTASSAATTSASFSNQLSSIPMIIAPFWDDLTTNPSSGGIPTLQNSMKYKVIGTTAGSRQFVFEWKNMTVFGAAGPQLNFQVVLDETNNSISINNGLFQGFNGTNNHRYTYSVGLAGFIISGNPLPGQVLAQQYENTTAFSNEYASSTNLGVNALMSIPECNSAIVFTPGTYAGFTPPAETSPINDEYTGAITVSALTSFPANLCGNFYTSRFATASSQGVCGGNNDDDVWFKFTANQINTTVRGYGSGGYVPRVQVLDASLNALSPAQCVVASAGGTSVDAVLTGITIGNLYYVRVYHDGGGVQATVLPTNVIVNPTGQIAFIGVANGGSGYTSTSTGSFLNGRIRITGGGGRDAAASINLTSGSVSSITIGNAGYGYTSAPTVTIEKPNWAHIGEFALVVYAPAINDECSGAKDLSNLTNTTCTIGQNSLTDNTGSATPSPEPTAGSCGTPDDDVWFKFTAIATSTNINVQGTGSFDAAFELFNGGTAPGTCGTKTSVSCTNLTGAGALESIVATTVIGNTYFVRVYHAGVGTVTGETFNICVSSAPPACPTGLLPATGTSVDATVGATLSWTAAVSPPSAVTTGYDVYFDTNNPPTTLVSPNQAGTTYATGVLVPNTIYYWSVAPKNSQGTTTGCTISSINTNAPACPTTPVPAIASSTCSSNTATVLSWAASAGATGYDVYFNAGAGPATTLVSANQPSLSYSVGVLTAGQYAWRVNAKNNNGSSTGCVDWTFTILPKPTVSATPAGPISICSPATQLLTASTNAATPTYKWLNNNVAITGATASTFTATVTGSYRVAVIDGVTGCTDSSVAVIVTIGIAPVISIIPANATISCDSAKLSVNIAGSSSIKITEVTLFRTGTGATSPYPAYIGASDADFLEISNVSGSPINVAGYSINDYADASATSVHPYSLPSGTIIPANSVLVIHLGSGTDDAANRYFNTGGSSDSWFSSSQVGFVLKDNTGTFIDVVGCGGSASGSYTFAAGTGVSASDWTGFAPNASGFAGVYRSGTADTNAGADWTQSNSPTPLQTIGTYNSVAYVIPTSTASWSPITGLFTDALLTTPYLSGNVSVVYAKPTTLGNNIYTATASNGGCAATASATVTVLPPGTRIWTGAISTDWANIGNWNCAGIPTTTSEVVIPNAVPNYPVINLNVEIKKITVNTGATVTTATGFTLTLNGN